MTTCSSHLNLIRKRLRGDRDGHIISREFKILVFSALIIVYILDKHFTFKFN